MRLGNPMLAVVMTLIGVTRLMTAQELQRPSLSIPAADNVWDYFCDPSHKTNPLDSLKCIRVAPQTQLTFDGELRNRGEYFDHTVLGSDSPSSGYLLQRYMLSTDLTVKDHFRFFSTLESGLENGRVGGPRPSTDEDRLFVHEAFLQFRDRKANPAFDLRVGRRDLSFGAGRLVGSRELPNVHSNFDGAQLILSKGSWQTTALAVRPSINSPGVFDDEPDHTTSFWGVYATKNNRQDVLDLYYLGLDRKSATYQAATGREQRQTIGIRFAGTHAAWDTDNEFIFQFGTFAGRPIAAWTGTTYTGYTFHQKSTIAQYRVAVDTGIASGNQNPTQGRFGTFNALFPRGAYFGYANFIGPYNVSVIRPSVRITLPKHHITIWPNLEWLWRQSKNDGVYSIPAVLVRAGSPNAPLRIGFQTDLNVTWEQNPHITWNIDEEHFFAGPFLHATTAGKSVNYVAPGVSYRF